MHSLTAMPTTPPSAPALPASHSRLRQAAWGAVRVFLAALLWGAAPSCSSLPTTICDRLCECEHCGDVRHDSVCLQQELVRDIADSYGCHALWETWAQCVDDNGTCNESEARFSTREPGSCSGEEQDFGFPCDTTSDCTDFGDTYYCVAGSCRFKTCADSGNFPCATDDDCPQGDDRCAEARADLGVCVTDAAEVNPELPLLFGGGAGARPGTGGSGTGGLGTGTGGGSSPPSPADPAPASAVCGNGLVEGDEQCDDGNSDDDDDCTNACTLPR